MIFRSKVPRSIEQEAPFLDIFPQKALRYKKKLFIFAPANEKGAIAQLVEQRTENPCVPGSIPGGTTKTNGFFLKSPEIQLFQGIFLFPRHTKTCIFRNLKMSHSVVFFQGHKKTTEFIILHLFSIICIDHSQVQKSIFAYLLE